LSDELEGQILAAGSILDAFGNAKTFVNDNSTRFCRFAKLIVDSSNKWISGIRFETSLLEKSRVTDRKQGDRNFHIFYMMN